VDNALPVMRGDSVVIEARPMRACIDVRGDGADARFRRAVASVADVEPTRLSGASVAGLLAAILWLGPDEWLLVSETQRGADLLLRLQSAMDGIHSAVTDVSSASIVYAVRGAKARDVLAKGCSLDLHQSRFTPGTCARTLLGKAPVLLHLRTSEPEFEVYVARSLREYAWAWFSKAAQDLYLAPEPPAVD